MSIWKVLGIEETKDKNIVKNAYRSKLVDVNPEDDPKGFMILRKAYEDAIKETEKVDVEKSTEDLLLGKIEDIYNDFQRRIDKNSWGDLFQEDEFVSLDTSEDSMNKLLRFFMDNFHLPQQIWKFVVDYFGLAERRKELVEIYPDDFIDYIFSNSKYEDLISYNLFEGEGKDIDEYIDLYYKFDNAYRRSDIEEEEKCIIAMEDSAAYHPYIIICKVRHEIHKMHLGADEDVDSKIDKDKMNQLRKEAQGILAEHDDDVNLLILCGDLSLFVDDKMSAKDYYDKANELAPKNYLVMGKIAELHYVNKEYEKSRDIYIELLKINHYDNNARAAMIKANAGLIEENTKKLDEEPENNKLRLDIAWSLYQSYRFEEAIEILDSFEPDEDRACEYYNVKGRNYLCLEKYEQALECFVAWKNKILELPEDDKSEETNKKRVRFNYVNFLIADCYLKTKQYDEAREYFNIAISKEHEEIVLSYEAICELEYETKNYEACIKACERLSEREDRNYVASLFMAKSFFYMGYYKDAINYCEKAIGIYPYMTDPYVYEVRIYSIFSQYDNANMVIERYENYGIESDKLDYWKAEIKEAQGDCKSALEILDNIIKRISEKDYVSDLKDISDVYALKGTIEEENENFQEALESYNRALEINSMHKSVHGKKGVLLRKLDEPDDAIDELNIQLSIEKQTYYLANRGLLYKHKKMYDESISDFEEILKLEEDNVYAIMHLAAVYRIIGKFDKALYNYNRALLYIETNKEYADILYINRARVLQYLDKFDESEKQYKLFFEEFGFNCELSVEYAELLYRMKRVDESINILKRAINEFEYNEFVRRCIQKLCYIYGIEGYVDKANECFELGISNEPSCCTYYGVMGRVFTQMGLFEQAQRMYLEAAELDKNNEYNYYAELADVVSRKKGLFKPTVRFYLSKTKKRIMYGCTCGELINEAKAKRASKDYNKAILILEKAVDSIVCDDCVSVKCHEVYYELGITYEIMKDYNKALKCYKKALQISGYNALYERCIKRIEKNDSRN